MRDEMHGNEKAFADKYMLGQAAGEYAIHGGGVPVKGVEGVVGVIVVSGLKQEEDHMVVIEALQMFPMEAALWSVILCRVVVNPGRVTSQLYFEVPPLCRFLSVSKLL